MPEFLLVVRSALCSQKWQAADNKHPFHLDKIDFQKRKLLQAVFVQA
jgi:hypothetical protein